MRDQSQSVMRVDPRTCTTENAGVAVDMEQVLREYLRILLGGRTHAVLAKALGFKTKSGVSMLLSGERTVTVEHLQAIGTAWGIRASAIFGDLALISQNLELGRPANYMIGGTVTQRGASATQPGDEAPRGTPR